MSSIRSPVRFLRPSTVVDDYYTGELKTALEKMSLSEMSFVMYYAPWDAESQRVRWHFEAAARYYHKEVRFISYSYDLFNFLDYFLSPCLLCLLFFVDIFCGNKLLAARQRVPSNQQNLYIPFVNSSTS